MELEARIRQFIASNFYLTDGSDLAAETSLFDTGILDSTGVLEVIGFLETDLGILVANDEMISDNLDSIAKIERFVARKTGKGAAS